MSVGECVDILRSLMIASLLMLVLAGTPSVFAGDVTIRVVDGDKPVPDAVVVIMLNGSLESVITTDSNGTAVASLSPGTYSMFVIVGDSTYKFKQTIQDNTTNMTLNIGGGLQNYVSRAKTVVDQYKYYLLAVGVFVILVLFALLVSGKKTPRW
ncbi:MAG: hypothetical protein QXZ63_06695 [Sulfolobales archaeon]